MDESVIIYILLIHFLADAGLQTHWQAMNKSISNIALLRHVGVYSGVWLLASPIYLGWEGAAVMASVTFVTHFIVDYITSRVSKQFFHVEDFHNGWVVVLGDQLIHYVQLFLTFSYIYERTGS